MVDAAKTKRIYCNSCKNVTRHNLVGSNKYISGGDDEGPSFWGEHRLWVCAGCDTGTMEDYYSADYMMDPGGENIFESIFHPKRAHSMRSTKHFVKLPGKLGVLYREVISAHNEKLHLLCAAGLRSLVEGVCADKHIAGSNLESKIEGMKTLLPENIVKNLHGFRFIGNRAVHELEAPKEGELTLAVEVIEDILNFLYALDYKASLFGKLRASQGDTAMAASVSTTKATQCEPASLSPEEETPPADSRRD